MLATNNYGRKVLCTVCQCENLKGYKSYTPAFANAIDSVFIGWCDKHEKEGLQEYYKGVESTDRLNQACSNS